MFKTIKIMALTLLVFGMFSCSDDENNPVIGEPNTMKTIATKSTENYTFKILTEGNDSLKEGYNIFYIRAYDWDNKSIAKDLSINLVMTMDEMMHSTPFSTTIQNIGGKEYIRVEATFVMPNTEMDKWNITFKSEEKIIDENLDLNVSTTGNVKGFVYNDKSYYLVLHSPLSPKVGKNNFILKSYAMEDMMTYSTVNNLEIEAEPFMPSMGHGSNGNVNPTNTNDGIYTGTVNFSMTGDWEIRLIVKENDVIIGTPVFKLEVQ